MNSPEISQVYDQAAFRRTTRGVPVTVYIQRDGLELSRGGCGEKCASGAMVTSGDSARYFVEVNAR